MKFDRFTAEATRKANPSLTIFDTGEVLEPSYHRSDKYGKAGPVDYDDSSGTTVLTVCAYPSAEDDDTVIVQIDSALFTRLKIVVNDGDLVAIDTEGRAEFLTSEVQEAMTKARDALALDDTDALIDLLRLLEGND